MEWWTHLWLNEGFATWIEYLCVDHTHPEYDIWTNFLSREYASAMSLDALANSHAIEVSCLFNSSFSFFTLNHAVRSNVLGENHILLYSFHLAWK